MLFGMTRVGKGLHFAATLLVAVGTLLSAFWILAANSWMQTPAGHITNEVGQFVPGDWWEIIFNPSSRTGSSIPCSEPTSRLPWWWGRSAPGTCCGTAATRERA
jgi:hypothetical protein